MKPSLPSSDPACSVALESDCHLAVCADLPMWIQRLGEWTFICIPPGLASVALNSVKLQVADGLRMQELALLSLDMLALMLLRDLAGLFCPSSMEGTSILSGLRDSIMSWDQSVSMLRALSVMCALLHIGPDGVLPQSLA